MSLTNDQITAKNFQEFYAQIRPYLNGQVPPVFNKFGKSDLYSESEQIIGRWIDGKPIYQKTISCGALPNNTTKSTAHGISNIDDIVNLYGVAKRSSDSTYIPIGCPTVNVTHIIEIYIDATNIVIGTGTNKSQFAESYVTICYTKTTDSSVEIGNDTDYSTTEKIVGTWIDGKPLYQKTYSLTNVSATKNLSTLLSVGSMNVKDIKGYCSFNNVNADLSVNTILGSDDYQFFVYNDNGTLKYTAYYYGNTIKEVVLTLQYTKTTD